MRKVKILRITEQYLLSNFRNKKDEYENDLEAWLNDDWKIVSINNMTDKDSGGTNGFIIFFEREKPL